MHIQIRRARSQGLPENTFRGGRTADVAHAHEQDPCRPAATRRSCPVPADLAALARAAIVHGSLQLTARRTHPAIANCAQVLVTSPVASRAAQTCARGAWIKYAECARDIAICCLLLCLANGVQIAFGHGGVVLEEDLCVINIGYLQAHFKIYVPQEHQRRSSAKTFLPPAKACSSWNTSIRDWMRRPGISGKAVTSLKACAFTWPGIGKWFLGIETDVHSDDVVIPLEL